MYEHLISRIPNYCLFRWVTKYINRKMKRSNSKYRLQVRYRVPKKDHKYGYGGNLRCKNAKRFSIYLLKRR